MQRAKGGKSVHGAPEYPKPVPAWLEAGLRDRTIGKDLERALLLERAMRLVGPLETLRLVRRSMGLDRYDHIYRDAAKAAPKARTSRKAGAA
jgi:hypothetical protein